MEDPQLQERSGHRFLNMAFSRYSEWSRMHFWVASDIRNSVNELILLHRLQGDTGIDYGYKKGMAGWVPIVRSVHNTCEGIDASKM